MIFFCFSLVFEFFTLELDFFRSVCTISKFFTFFTSTLVSELFLVVLADSSHPRANR